MKYPIRLIGVGSPAVDDQLGWQLLTTLEQVPTLQPYFDQFLQMQLSDRPGLRLLNYLQDCELAFLFDAVINVPLHPDTPNEVDNSEGIIRCEDVSIYAQPGLISTHGFGIADAIQLGAVLNKLPQKIIFYGLSVTHCQKMGSKTLIKKASEQITAELIQHLPNLKQKSATRVGKIDA